MATRKNGASNMTVNGPANGVQARSKEKKKVASGLVKCPVCKKPYRQPKLLPCLHSFCEACLKTCLESNAIGPGQPFLCPLCHAQCVIPKRGTCALPDNVLLQTLGQVSARKSVPPKPRCEGCETAPTAVAKCIECDDWLCHVCCDMHARVKVSRSHHVVSPDDLDAGQADSLIKANFQQEPCSKHGEPLKLFCTEPSCQFPICTICKTTLGHDGHKAIELEEKAQEDVQIIQNLLPNVHRSTDACRQRMRNVETEDKNAQAIRKELHKAINQRMEEVVHQLVEKISSYAENLHGEVERLVKEHRDDIAEDLKESEFMLQGMTCAATLAQGLLESGRTEEMVRMSPVVLARLQTLQKPPDTNPPGWHRPRMHPALIPSDSQIATIFGELTFEGHIIRSQQVRSFSTETAGDTRNCSLSDVSISEDNDIVVVDKDNKKVKVFSSTGEFLFSSEGTNVKSPIRATVLKNSGNVLIKDDKILRIMQPDGEVTGAFASQVRHPIATAQNQHGEILVSDWNSGNIHCFTPDEKEVYKFCTNLEAPAYIGCNRRNHILVSDWKQNVVRVYERGGRFLWQYGREEGQHVDHPYGVCSDRYGHLLVADGWNHRIHLVSEEGRFLRYLLDKDSGLHYPQALAVTMEGYLVVAELNGTIKIFQYLA